MELHEFRKGYLENVKAVAAAENDGTSASFVRTTCDDLVVGELFDDYELCHYTGTSSRKKYRVDAYSYDDYDKSMTMIIVDYSGIEEITKITQTDAITLFGRLRVLAEESIKGKLRDEIEISTPTYDLVDKLYSLRTEIRKLKFYIVTDKEMSDKIGNFEEKDVGGIPCEYHLWDIVRLYRMKGIGDGHEPVELNLKSIISSGIPCLVASDVDIASCKCYLSVLPATFLADIYDLYGSRLLEGNVRTFLSARGNVNKGIRRTILGDERNMFFAYNNGISATASEIKTEEVNGIPHIVYIKDLQIVNGGQTTASLSNTRYKDKANLDGIFVQMKLTVVEDGETASEIIPNISRCSNSQNKVSEADFFSNHEFNIRMQKISRQLYAPAALGVQYETHWFYERARGQYENEQSKMTPSQKKQFVLVNPKAQLFDKTVLAKLENSWRLFPQIASAGAQKSFKKWAEVIVGEWEKNPDVFNDLYYKNIVSLLIIYRTLEKAIPKQTWYESGYRANIIVYSISFLHYKIQEQFHDMTLDLGAIWSKQSLSDEFAQLMLDVAKHIFECITDDSRPVMNVTEWCKREPCWDFCKKSQFVLPTSIESMLISTQDAKDNIRSSKKDRKMVNGIELQSEVITKGSKFWKELGGFMLARKLLNPKEMGIVQAAVEIDKGKIPSEKQCFVLMEILEKAKDEGFIVQ
ncbi:AIPR family protein [Sedimentibacter sp.]|uniref:AIPR family protein n=1 Tax=Sedimentibacter sp. TaxID=1960295 RepID=UPI00289981A5|nr:AIPR family protein [Sedimentibacter sp.]